MKKNQILAEVICPAAQSSYDFVLSTSVQIGDLIKTVTEEITGNDPVLSGIVVPEKADIFSKDHDHPLDRKKTLEDYGILSGCSLMIV